VPPYMAPGVLAYIVRGQPTGDFLRDVFSNDLRGAVCRADPANLAHLAVWVKEILPRFPVGALGSNGKVNDWIDAGGLVGLAKQQEEKKANG